MPKADELLFLAERCDRLAERCPDPMAAQKFRNLGRGYRTLAQQDRLWANDDGVPSSHAVDAGLLLVPSST